MATTTTCPKCGGGVRAATPTVIANFQNNDVRPALVQFRKGVYIKIPGVIERKFYPAQVIILNFSLIDALLATFENCLIFLKADERDLFYA